jgi:hypothetical protein
LAGAARERGDVFLDALRLEREELADAVERLAAEARRRRIALQIAARFGCG